jgi:hypothetical protein
MVVNRVMHKANSVNEGQDKRGTSKFVTIHTESSSIRVFLAYTSS